MTQPTWKKMQPTKHFSYLSCSDINPQNNQSCFTQFYPRIFSVLAVEKEKKNFIGSKQVFSECWTNEKFIFFFNSSNWENGENKIDGSMSQKKYMVDQKSQKFGLKIVLFWKENIFYWYLFWYVQLLRQLIFQKWALFFSSKWAYIPIHFVTVILL